MSDPTASNRSGFRPAIIFGTSIGLGFLLLLLLQPSADWFEHPLRIEREGAMPANTIRGARLLAMALPWAALAWFATPFILKRLGPAPGNGDGNGVSRREILLLFGAMALGVILRAMRLGESLWYDEIAAMLSFSIHGPGAALGNYYALSNHVLHSALASISMDLAGEVNEPILRTPAMVFGMATIPAAYLLGRVAMGARLGILMALLVAVMPVAVLESVEARGYSMVMFFAFFATWLLLLIDATGRPIAVMGYALALALGTWAHLAFVFVALGHGCLAAWMILGGQNRLAGTRILVGLILAGITSLALLMPILPDLLQLRSQFQAIDGNEPGVMGPEGIHALLQLAGAWIWWAALPGFILAAIGLTTCLQYPRVRMAVTASILGGLLAVVFTILGDSWIYARFLLYMVVGSTLLIGLGILAVSRRGAGYGAIVVATILAGTWILDLATRPPKQPIREAVVWLAELAETTGNSRALSIGLVDDVASYYAQPLGIELIKTGSLGDDLPPLDDAPDLAIALYPDRLDPDVRATLADAGYRESRRFRGWLDWDHGDVLILQRSDD